MQVGEVRRKVTASIALATFVLASMPQGIIAQSKPAPAPAKPPATTAKPPAPQTKPPAPGTKPASPQPDPTVDGGWPRAYMTAGKAEVLIHQPQVASWERQKHMVAYAAVAYQPPGPAKLTIGTIRLEADTSVALEDRLVQFAPIKITETNFGELPKEQVQEILTTISSGIPEEERVIALDRVLASVDRSQIFPRNVEGVKADPPTIFFSNRPALLVSFDGDPVWSPIEGNDLKFAVNTNWDVFQHEGLKTFFLRNERVWLKASELKGPWTPAGTLPPSFSKLPATDANWNEVRAALPGSPIAAASMPAVHVSTAPAELIIINGAAVYQPVAGTKLVWVSNSESDLFRLGANGPVYFLVAGRWFTAPGFTGPWTFATLNLPEDFKKISLEHPRSRVLASVPGTPQAAEAVLLASVPQIARVNRKEIKAPEVVYQGQAEFQPIEKTSVARAVNTDKDIIKVGDLYYMCFQGVWFLASSPAGPWQATDSVPKEIYEIPASSPSHHVTYVTVEEDDDDEWITYAAVGGYTGMMVAWGCTVYGSGWYYPPYVWYGGYYPVYYPFYPTYGVGAWYNPWTGAYGRGAAWYGPYGGAGVGARYNPTTGRYSRGAVAWGPYGARGAARSYNPRTGAVGATRQGSGVYGSWGSTAVRRGDQWAQTARVTNRVTGNTTRVTQGSGGGTAITRNTPGAGGGGIAKTGGGDVYAGRDGSVYRRQDGTWQKYDNGSWGSVDKPTPQSGSRAADRSSSGASAGTTDRSRSSSSSETMGQLERDRAARTEGTTRTRDYSTTRSSGGSRSGSYGGSYRAGGGMRGGGRRR